jgi:hypothetical protein
MASITGSGITPTLSGNFLLGKFDEPLNNQGVMNWLKKEPEFSLFCNLVEKAGLEQKLNNCDETLTVFAPPNSVLENVWNKIQHINPRVFVSSHILRDAFPREDFNGEIFQTRDILNRDSVIDARNSTQIFYGKARHGLSVSLEWISNGCLGNMQVKCNNGYIHIISAPIFLEEC